MLVHMLKLFPLLLTEIEETVKSFDRFKWCFIERVSTTNHVEISAVKDGDGVVVS